MVLLFNSFITNKSSTGGVWEELGLFMDRGNLNNPNKLDILKYCLASHAVAYPWKRVIIKVQLDEPYNTEKNRKDLETFVYNEFKGTEIFFSSKRNLHQSDWIKTYDLINDDILFYQGNHDHIFLDNSSTYLEELVKLKNIYNENLTIYPSHYSETIRTAKGCYVDIRNGETIPPSFTSDYKINKNHISRTHICFDSFSIITKEIYKNWFLEGNWNQIDPLILKRYPSGQIEMARAEGTGIIGLAGVKEIIGSPIIKQILVFPFKELFRHFDGYWHQYISNSQCPSLDIPPGFFENNIKIRYGYDDYKEGWVNVNPKNPNYYAHDKSGTDYKFTLRYLPLVWKSRISVIDSNPNVDEEEMLQYYLKSVLEMIYTSPYYDSYIDKELEVKILNKYLEQYPEYNKI